MTSSHDELAEPVHEPAVDIASLRVVRGKRLALDDINVRIGRGTISG